MGGDYSFPLGALERRIVNDVTAGRKIGAQRSYLHMQYFVK